MEFKDTPGLANVIILMCHHGDLWRLLDSVSSVGCPLSTEIRFLARAKYLPFFFVWVVCSLEQIWYLLTKIHAMIRFQIAPEFSQISGSGWRSP